MVAAIALCLLARCHGAPAAPRDVVLVILDTTRADHLSAYGYSRPTTPNLARLAAEGERFDAAWAQSCWTLPSVATLLTGQPPHVHGASRTATGAYGVRPGVPTLAERMRGAGYRTAAIMNVAWCSPRLSNLDRGFDAYDFHTSDGTNRNHRDARETTDAALAWLERQGSAPVFLVVHYFDAHLTYDPPAPFDTRFEPDAGPRVPPGFGSAAEMLALRSGAIVLDARHRESLIARYDGEIAFADEQFGRLRAGLERLGRWDDAVVLVVGDHGEEFWDHGGFEHGHSHHREVLRVPLILRRPGGPSGVTRAERVRQLDVAPTVLNAAGLEPSDLPGQRLDERSGARFSVAEGSLWSGDLLSVRSDDGTLLLDRRSGRSVFYAPGDVAESTPLPATTPEAQRLRRILDALPPERTRVDEPRQFTPEQLEQLRSLGYVQ